MIVVVIVIVIAIASVTVMSGVGRQRAITTPLFLSRVPHAMIVLDTAARCAWLGRGHRKWGDKQVKDVCKESSGSSQKVYPRR